jgi:hypothetical protein
MNGRDVVAFPPTGADIVGTMQGTNTALTPSDYIVDVPGLFDNVPITNDDVQNDLLVRFDLGDVVCVAVAYDPESTLEVTYADCLSDREAGLYTVHTTIQFFPFGQVIWEETMLFFVDDSVEVERFQGVYEHDPATRRFRAGAVGSRFGLRSTPPTSALISGATAAPVAYRPPITGRSGPDRRATAFRRRRRQHWG